MGLLRSLFGNREQEAAARGPRLRVTATLYENVPVVGESFYQPALLAITGAERGEAVECECIAELIPEPENPHDPNAIKVLIDGLQVGHLSRQNAIKHGPRIRAMLERGEPTICDAYVGCAPDKGNGLASQSLYDNLPGKHVPAHQLFDALSDLLRGAINELDDRDHIPHSTPQSDAQSATRSAACRPCWSCNRSRQLRDSPQYPLRRRQGGSHGRQRSRACRSSGSGDRLGRGLVAGAGVRHGSSRVLQSAPLPCVPVDGCARI
jgi:hypothetical protein